MNINRDNKVATCPACGGYVEFSETIYCLERTNLKCSTRIMYSDVVYRPATKSELRAKASQEEFSKAWKEDKTHVSSWLSEYLLENFSTFSDDTYNEYLNYCKSMYPNETPFPKHLFSRMAAVVTR